MTTIIDSLRSTEDLKHLHPAELESLCSEIREILVQTTHSNGGHLASNLGVVELTLALHRTFNSPRDKIIWDVGHQCYIHKLLTGRRNKFSTLRQHEGISGFPDRFESVHDFLSSGHAGTSISSALGMAMARDLEKEDYNVIAVIGDGSLGSGIAMEAINHAGHTGTKITIILNDNGMAISPPVGGIHRLLQKVRLNSNYSAAKTTLKRKISPLPQGKTVIRFLNYLKNIFKGTLFKGIFWEEMGFLYLGPIDGHDLSELEKVLSQTKEIARPVILHVITKKGKGYHPAESNAVKFHGIPPAKSLMKTTVKELSYSQVFARSLIELMEKNERIVAITAAMLDGTGLAPVAELFPDRVFDVGICEQHAVTMAAGLAAAGHIPVVAIYSTFLQRSYDQIIHDVCLQQLPVIFAIDRAGIVGDDGKTHQGMFDISFLRCLPHMAITAPRDGKEMRNLLYTAVRSGKPFAIRYPRGTAPSAGILEDIPQALPLGRGELLTKGDDCAIIASGSMVQPSLEAAHILKKTGIQCAVADIRYLKPIDSDLIADLAKRTGKLITVEENVTAGGLGSSVLELLHQNNIHDIPVVCMGLPDCFIEHGPQNLIRSLHGLNAEGISRSAMSLFSALEETEIKEQVGI